MEKVVVITGASRGIGRNIAYNLALEGYKVVANYNKSEKEALELKEELEKNGIEIDIFKADVSKKEDVEALINFAINKHQKIDVLINNAGIAQSKLFTEISDEEFDKAVKKYIEENVEHYKAIVITL